MHNAALTTKSATLFSILLFRLFKRFFAAFTILEPLARSDSALNTQDKMHYLRIKSSYEDLGNKLRWLHGHQAVAERIAQGGEAIVSKWFRKEDMQMYLKALVLVHALHIESIEGDILDAFEDDR